MIPLKQLKKDLMKQFADDKQRFEKLAKRKEKSCVGNYLNFPWCPLGCAKTTELRWNLKQHRFDRINFFAFGQHHHIKILPPHVDKSNHNSWLFAGPDKDKRTRTLPDNLPAMKRSLYNQHMDGELTKAELQDALRELKK